MACEEDQELWEEIDETDDYVRLPNQYELHEKSIMEKFAYEIGNQRVSEVLFDALRRRRPYRCFKDKINDLGISQIYYDYRNRTYINTAEEISGIPSSWPGYTLENGSSGAKIRQLQEQLNVIAGAYPALPKIQADGVYGPATAAAVREFQSIFGLPQTGTVDYRTWYKISQIYVGVSRIAELN